jgi:hypothetical protein
MCEILEDEKNPCQNQLSCASSQFTYKQIFIAEFIIDNCFNQTIL